MRKGVRDMTNNGSFPERRQDRPFPQGSYDTLPENRVAPLADIYETPDSYVLSLDMPGARKDGISVSLEKGVLTVSADLEAMHKQSTTLLRREIMTTGYHRAFTLGEGIDRGNVDARFEDGVLTMKLFKSPEMKPKEIQIH
jgi:HSP20 family protein